MRTYIVVTPFFPSPDNWRGAYCLDFVKALRRHRPNLRVEVFVPGKEDDYEINGVVVHKFKIRTLPSNVLPFLFKRYNEESFLNAVVRAGIELDEIAICHGHTANFAIYPLAVKRQNPGCKTLLHHHDPSSFGLNLGVLRHNWLYNSYLFLALRKLHEAIDCHVFISEVVKRNFLKAPNTEGVMYEDYKKQMRGLPFRSAHIKNSVILHNGVDTKIFRAQTIAKSNEDFKIGCIGNFIDWKDQISLIKAAERFKRIKIIFIGSGAERAKCESYVKKFGVNAEFRNEVVHEQLPDFYRSLDLFVLPSYFEGFGCVYTESWACGTPFIACEGQGIEDLIPEEERPLWLVKPMDAMDLAKKIKYFIDYRPMQHLNAPNSFDELIPPFLKEIGL